MNKNILFFINGEGLGNSTRCHAVIQKLLRNKVNIGIVAAKNSFWYFSNKKLPINIYQIDQMSYHISEDGKINTFKTLFKTFQSLKIYKNNLNKIKNIIEEFRPNIIITDSNYVFNFLNKFQIPIISLNNSCLTIAEYKKQSNIPNSIKPHYFFIEKLDYFYHSKFPDLTISCGITSKEKKQFKNFCQISPIYREGLFEKENIKKKICMIMLSGASNFKKYIDLSFIDDDIIFLNPHANYKNLINFKTYPKTHDNLDLLNTADYFIINSGYSAITESLFMKKPVISIPMTNHSEQWLNAKKVEDERYGLISSIDNLKEKYLIFNKNYKDFKNNLIFRKKERNGADEAAEIILKF